MTTEQRESLPAAISGRVGNSVAAVVLLAVSALVFVQSGTIGEPGRATDPGAGGYPSLLAILLAGLAVFLFFQTNMGDELPDLRGGLGVLLAFSLLVAYALVMRQVGYLMATTVFLLAGMLWMGARSYWRVGLFSVGLSVALFLLFHNIFGVALPRGYLERLLS